MATTVTFKRGTSFAGNVTFTPSSTGPQNLLGTTVTSNVIDAGNITYPLNVVIAGDGLSFTLTYPQSTAGWTIGLAKWDIKFSTGGSVYFTETMRITVIDEVTV